MDVPTTLLVSNDYPPRVGGIQRTLESLVDRLPPDRVGVFAPMWPGASEFDGRAPYRTFRQPERFLLPSPSLAVRIERAVEELGADVVLFGATYPLALLGPRLARRGIPYLAAAHGFEYWLSIVPGTHSLVRRATSRAAHVPVLCSEFIARRVRTAVPANVPLSVIYPAADIERFHPDQPAQDIRARHGLGSRPLVVCVSRLVARKGQDMLIRSMSEVRRRAADGAVALVG